LKRWFVLLEKGVFHRFSPKHFNHNHGWKMMKPLGDNPNDRLVQQQFWSVAHCSIGVPPS
jgi:hypothetical protein